MIADVHGTDLEVLFKLFFILDSPFDKPSCSPRFWLNGYQDSLRLRLDTPGFSPHYSPQICWFRYFSSFLPHCLIFTSLFSSDMLVQVFFLLTFQDSCEGQLSQFLQSFVIVFCSSFTLLSLFFFGHFFSFCHLSVTLHQ